MVRQPADDFARMLTVTAIGRYVITFSHMEHAMMRLIEWLEGNPTGGNISERTIKMNWSQLVEHLRRSVAGTSVEQDVTQLLHDHHVDTLAFVRHSLVHGSVNIGPRGSIDIVRRLRDGTSPIILASREEIDEECQHVADLHVALDRLLPQAYRRVTSNLVAGVVGLTREQAIAQGLDPDRHIDEQRPPMHYDDEYLADEPTDLQDDIAAED